MSMIVIWIVIAAGLVALLGRAVWLPLPLRPTVAPRSGIGRDFVLGVVVLRTISVAYGRLIETYLRQI